LPNCSDGAAASRIGSARGVKRLFGQQSKLRKK
jgi:hypothetical protein